jgi:hypothetical protein
MSPGWVVLRPLDPHKIGVLLCGCVRLRLAIAGYVDEYSPNFHVTIYVEAISRIKLF